MFNIFGTKVTIESGDALQMSAEGLLLAANDHLWMGGGLAMKAKQGGGEAVEIEAVRQGPVALGTAVATGAGQLAFKRIYHAVVMGQDLRTRHDEIEPALKAALDLAARDRIASLILTPLESEESIGPFHDAAHAVVKTLFDALSATSKIETLTLAVSKPETRDAYRAAFLQFIGGTRA